MRERSSSPSEQTARTMIEVDGWEAHEAREESKTLRGGKRIRERERERSRSRRGITLHPAIDIK